MGLPNLRTFVERPPSKYGGASSQALETLYLATVCLALALLVLFLAMVPAAAQQASSPGFDTRQTEKYFDDQLSRQERPAARSDLRVPHLARPQPATADAKPLFVLRVVAIQGAQALPHDRIAAAYQPYLGKMVSQADLVAIADAISELYRAAGFHLSRAIIPPQDIQGGRIVIRVIEGAITDIALKGDDAERFGVRPYLNPVLAERPSCLSTLERQLLLINGLPGVRITDSALEEIGDLSGHFRLVLTLKTWHVYAWVGLDNLGASGIGPWQGYATTAFNSAFLTGDTLAVNLSTTPNDPRELGFGRLSYDVPVGTDGWRVGASALYSEVRPGDDRRLYNDNTITEAFEVRTSITPLQSQASTLTFTAAVDVSNVSENTDFGQLYDDHIRTLSLTTDYRLQDSLGGVNYFTLSYRQGLDIFGASHSDDLISHAGAVPDFSVFDAWFTRYQTLSAAWSLKLAAATQMANAPLFTSQQFYVGGAAFGRGYGAAELSGDNGLAGSVELRYDHRLNYKYWSGFQLYGFFDAGAVWNYGFTPADGLMLTSVGGGVRLFLCDDLTADFGVAFPLGYRAPENSARDARFMVSISSAFKLLPGRAPDRL
jgi:hemolysin activation/secretion protein